MPDSPPSRHLSRPADDSPAYLTTEPDMDPGGPLHDQTNPQLSPALGVRVAEAHEVAFLAPPQRAGELGRLGPYRVLKVIGHGGMGMVFRAEDPRLGRTVALKVMLPAVATKKSARERFLREARAAARLMHDNIIPVYAADEAGGVLYIAMPLLKGTNLEDYLLRRGELTCAQALRVGREAARGLAAAHAKGLIHRDIKPANLWLDANAKGRVKILDFGLARLLDADDRLTQDGMIVGTPGYMAPEQANDSPVTAATDLFSLGAVLYRLCAGRRPFSGTTPYAACAALATETPTPVELLAPDIEPGFAAVIMQMLEKDPGRRPVSAAEVSERLYALEKERMLAKLSRDGTGGLRTVRAGTPDPDEAPDTQVNLGRTNGEVRPVPGGLLQRVWQAVWATVRPAKRSQAETDTAQSTPLVQRRTKGGR